MSDNIDASRSSSPSSRSPADFPAGGGSRPEPVGRRVKVLFLLSCERSGSTITGSLLSQLDGWFGGGEIRRLWHDLESDPARCGCGKEPRHCEIWETIGPTRLDPRCGCGRPLRSCDIWAQVAARALERSGIGLTPSEVVQLQRAVVRYRHKWRAVPGLLRQRNTGLTPEVSQYSALMGQLFRSLQEVSGCRVIVDISKEAVDAIILSMDPEIDLYLLHLVRDPRAVLYSTYRRYSPVLETGLPDADPRVSRPRQAAYLSAHWAIQSVSAEALAWGQNRLPLLHVSYEDLLRRPTYWLDAIARFVGEDPGTLPRLDGESVELRPSHTVTGNRSRFRTGVVELAPDTEWEPNLHPVDAAVSTLLTLPLLRRYRYPLRRPRARERDPVLNQA